MDDIQKLKEVLINGNPMLFLGAGFSYGSKNRQYVMTSTL